MKKRLLYVPKPQSFTDDSTGEVISGGKILICDTESRADNYGIGLFGEMVWLSTELLEPLFKSVTAKELPCLVDIVTEQRTIKGKSRIIAVNKVQE